MIYFPGQAIVCGSERADRLASKDLIYGTLTMGSTDIMRKIMGNLMRCKNQHRLKDGSCWSGRFSVERLIRTASEDQYVISCNQTHLNRNNQHQHKSASIVSDCELAGLSQHVNDIDLKLKSQKLCPRNIYLEMANAEPEHWQTGNMNLSSCVKQNSVTSCRCSHLLFV